LTHLDFGKNPIDDEGMKIMAQFLSGQKELEFLNIEQCIKTHKTTEHLDGLKHLL